MPCGSGKKYKACCQGGEAHASPTGNLHAAIDTARLLSFFNAVHFAPLENELNRLTREHPQSSFLWSLLGATLQMQGKEGLAALQKATLLSPNDVEAHVNLGTAQ
ncbi:SEC-C domain-containing protein [Propionivibrio sp.]|uniref:SEC-C domain-containing protein n=1 Tax=Propionivibrio sp. TaxID=2212460 RepID=UPI00343535AE